ncbi:hypothetical protein [uncultured Deinococcus sp.]|uniref:hypothetical protein n=1 Tax=uncultured Deinococcus sp. TaxID=158789 RepID=UPI002586EB61|nr:hypothetical protein [uncultured Deinococcus sp.]
MKFWLLAAFAALSVPAASACRVAPADAALAETVTARTAGVQGPVGAWQTGASPHGGPAAADPAPPHVAGEVAGRPRELATRREQDAVLERADQLMARLEQAVAERRLSQARANRWRSELHTVRRDVQQAARRQGVVSAAEQAGYDRVLAGVERGLGDLRAPR